MDLQPHLPAEELRFFTEFLNPKTSYLEYGSGGSTITAAKHGVKIIVSVESDTTWIDRLANEIPASHKSKVTLLFADIGPTKEWGWPTSEEKIASWPSYVLTPWKHCQGHNIEPNLVLIDGRFRIASFCASALFSKSRTRILFDDCADRPHYHVVEEFIRPTRTVGRMCEFITPKRSPRAVKLGLIHLLSESMFDPA